MRVFVNGLYTEAVQRYEQLVASGVEHCLPGQALKVPRNIKIIKFEMRIGLIYDAENNIAKLFKRLDELRSEIENRALTSCIRNFLMKHHEMANNKYEVIFTPLLPKWKPFHELIDEFEEGN